jgi:hypothetical protein
MGGALRRGRLDLHDAVDRLQAIAWPLIDIIGQDAVQTIMAAAFKPHRMRERVDANASDADANASPVFDDYGLGQGWDSPMPDPVPSAASEKSEFSENSAPARFRTPQSTVDALLYVLRRGLSCLSDPANQERLSRCDEAAIRTIAAELLTWPGQTRKGEPRPWLPAWAPDDAGKLVDAWNALKGAS